MDVLLEGAKLHLGRASPQYAKIAVSQISQAMITIIHDCLRSSQSQTSKPTTVPTPAPIANPAPMFPIKAPKLTPSPRNTGRIEKDLLLF